MYLKHKCRNHSVKFGAFVAKPRLARAQLFEVLGRSWDLIIKEFHLDPAQRFAISAHIKENFRSLLLPCQIDKYVHCDYKLGLSWVKLSLI